MPDGSEPVVVGLLAEEGLAGDLAARLAEELPRELSSRFPGVEWRVEARDDRYAGASTSVADLVDVARRRLLDEGWELAVCLTDLPLHAGRRPVTAHASATHGVGLVSVPALGAFALERRVRTVVLRLIEGLLGESLRAGGDHHDGGRSARMRARLRELASPIGRVRDHDDDTIRFATAVIRGNLRLLVGMVRANRPTRLIVRLSRSLVLTLGVAAFTLTSSDIWLLSNGMSWPRLVLLAVGSVLITWAVVIVAHRLWERAPTAGAREQVVLFNLATALTIALGILTLYGALFVLDLASAGALIPASVLKQRAGSSGVDAYVKLACLVASLGTIGGALGSLVESDAAVREAAYRYRADERTESESFD